MHEHGITKNIVMMIVKECNKNNLKNLENVILEIGKLTTYKKDSIIMYFDIFRDDFPVLEDTKLEIVEVPGKVKCNKCGEESEIKNAYLICCNNCKTHDVEIISGRDIIVKEIKGK
jgi:hydrogenase nickel incorporation protein HypA/HybF